MNIHNRGLRPAILIPSSIRTCKAVMALSKSDLLAQLLPGPRAERAERAEQESPAPELLLEPLNCFQDVFPADMHLTRSALLYTCRAFTAYI